MSALVIVCGTDDKERTCPSGLSQSIMDLDTSKLVPFPPFDGSKFRRLMDQEMGFEL